MIKGNTGLISPPGGFSPPMLGLGRGTQDGFRLAEGLGPEVTWLGTKPKDRLGLAVGSWSQLGSERELGLLGLG